MLLAEAEKAKIEMAYISPEDVTNGSATC